MRWFITYIFRNKTRVFSTQAACEQLAVWEFSKDKAHKDAEFISCQPEYLYKQSKSKKHPLKKHSTEPKPEKEKPMPMPIPMQVNVVDTLTMQGQLNDAKHYLRFCKFDVSDNNIDDFTRAVEILDGVISELKIINSGDQNGQHTTNR